MDRMMLSTIVDELHRRFSAELGQFAQALGLVMKRKGAELEDKLTQIREQLKQLHHTEHRGSDQLEECLRTPTTEDARERAEKTGVKSDVPL